MLGFVILKGCHTALKLQVSRGQKVELWLQLATPELEPALSGPCSPLLPNVCMALFLTYV